MKSSAGFMLAPAFLPIARPMAGRKNVTRHAKSGLGRPFFIQEDIKGIDCMLTVLFNNR